MLIINLKTSIFIILMALMISGCGPSIPRNELHDLPPLMEIVALNVSEMELKLRITHRNKRVRESNQLSCQLALKDFKPIQFDQIPLPNLTHYAKETLTVDINQNSEINFDSKLKELPYVLDCFLHSENFRNEQIVKKSILYQVPGSNYEYR